MKRFLATVLIAGSSAMAGVWYAGVDAGMGKLDYTYSGNYVGTDSKSDTDITLKLGYIENDIRLGGQYHIFNVDGGSFDYIAANVDFIIPNSTPLKPFIGVSFGHFSLDQTPSGATQFVENKSWGYGLGVGLLYDLGRSFEVEAGYRIFQPKGNSSTVAGYTLEFDRFSNAYVGLNYKF